MLKLKIRYTTMTFVKVWTVNNKLQS